ncbi:ATP12 family protein, partial [Klebsiella pneumoniae]|uniref:ATP12 family protein n=1 Tax=Klebsiella pneumoniae TaxID=573 RepID=UPI003EE10AB4
DADKLTRIKRFYRDVTAGPVEGGHGVLLDARAAKKPDGRPLTAPNEALARLLAEEWALQGEFIDFALMPATRLAWTAIDRSADGVAALAA